MERNVDNANILTAPELANILTAPGLGAEFGLGERRRTERRNGGRRTERRKGRRTERRKGGRRTTSCPFYAQYSGEDGGQAAATYEGKTKMHFVQR